MRITNKSVLGNHLKDYFRGTDDIIPDVRCISIDIHIVDGGWLLHEIVWEVGQTFGEIILHYVWYIKNISHRVVVIFDGYGCASTKDHEHHRRQKHLSNNIHINKNNKLLIQQTQ